MKKSTITKNTIIFSPEYMKSNYDNGVVLHKTKLSLCNNNNFMKIFFNWADVLEENVDNLYGITYKRKTESFMFHLLSYICSKVNENNQVVIGDTNITFNISPTNKKYGYWNFNELFFISFEESFSYSIKNVAIDKIINKITNVIVKENDFLVAWINSCLEGEIPLIKEKINIFDNSDLPYFNYELNVFMSKTKKLEIIYEIKHDNIFNLEKFEDFINNRKRVLNKLNSQLNSSENVTSFYKRDSHKILFPLFNKINMGKEFSIPKELNQNKTFDDKDAIFQINTEYKEFSGKISAERFLKIQSTLNDYELKKFTSALSII